MTQRKRTASAVIALAIGITMLDGGAAWARAAPLLEARLVAANIPGASAVSQVGTFLNDPAACSHPIPSNFPTFIQPGAVLDPKRLLVGSRSNFGAPRTTFGAEGAFLSIDPSGVSILNVPANFAQKDGQASALGGRVQMFSANSPSFLNGINDPTAITAAFAGVGNPLGISNNNAFGRIWPANAPFGDDRVGTSSVLDPTGRSLAGAPNPLIGGVYAGSLTGRNAVASPAQRQIIPGALGTGAVGTALLGPSPDGSCKAVFAVVTAGGAIVQEHTLKGLDGIAPAGTIKPLQGRKWPGPNQDVEPRLGVLLNPYTAKPNQAWQLFISEPFDNTIALVDLVAAGPASNEVFSPSGPVKRIRSDAFNLPVDLAPAKVDTDDINWASNTTLDEGSDIYVANRGDNSIVRIRQDGSVVASRQVGIGGRPLESSSLNGIATSSDGTRLYVTFVGPGQDQGGVLELPAFSD